MIESSNWKPGRRVPATSGRPSDGAVGVPQPNRRLPGRPVASYPYRKPVSACSATTKAGNACKAKPVKGEGMCVGHLRQVNTVE